MSMAQKRQVTEVQESVTGESLAPEAARREKLVVTVVSAIVVALVFQGITMARNNYSAWRFEFTAIELVVALAASFAANLVPGLDERGHAWAQANLLAPGSLANRLVQVLPAVLVRAALMCACLSIPNATYVPMVIYREEVASPVLAVIARFLSDIPQAVVACLAVLLLVQRHYRRKAAQA